MLEELLHVILVQLILDSACCGVRSGASQGLLVGMRALLPCCSDTADLQLCVCVCVCDGRRAYFAPSSNAACPGVVSLAAVCVHLDLCCTTLGSRGGIFLSIIRDFPSFHPWSGCIAFFSPHTGGSHLIYFYKQPQLANLSCFLHLPAFGICEACSFILTESKSMCFYKTCFTCCFVHKMW